MTENETTIKDKDWKDYIVKYVMPIVFGGLISWISAITFQNYNLKSELSDLKSNIAELKGKYSNLNTETIKNLIEKSKQDLSNKSENFDRIIKEKRNELLKLEEQTKNISLTNKSFPFNYALFEVPIGFAGSGPISGNTDNSTLIIGKNIELNEFLQSLNKNIYASHIIEYGSKRILLIIY